MSARARSVLAGVVAIALVAWLESERLAPPSPPTPDAAHVAEKIRITRVELPPAPVSEPARAKRPPPPPPPARASEVRPASEPERAPSIAAAESPTRLRPDAAALQRGTARLRSGRFPRLRASYARIGFARYRDAVHQLGGAFFLYDAETRRPLARVDPGSGAILDELELAGLSVWPRDVTRHLPAALANGRERLGQSVDRVVLLPPTSLDAALLGGLDVHLRQLGIEPARVVRVDVAYELHGGRLACEVLTVALSDGNERDLRLHIDLSGGAVS